MAANVRVRIPPIESVETAIRVFWSYPELGNEQLTELFGKRSPTTYAKLKKAAWERMHEEDGFVTNATRVPTATAYRAWGIDINDLEERYKKLKKMGMIRGGGNP